MLLPVAGIAPLKKALIDITGNEATKFVNGLVTTRLLPNIVKKKEHTVSEQKHAELSAVVDITKNWGLMHEDIYDPEEKIIVSREGVNSMFLNSKGRVVTDCFLYSQPFNNVNNHSSQQLQKPSYLVEVCSSMSMQLMTMLKLHRLSADVSVSKEDSLHSYYYYNDTVEFDDWLENIQAKYFQTSTPDEALAGANSFIHDEVMFNSTYASAIIGFAIDNRIPNFGVKIVTNAPISIDKDTGSDMIYLFDLFSRQFKDTFEVGLCDEKTIIRRRYANGLFETSDVEKNTSLLPFESNVDYTNGLSLDKGCYVGQELTIRTFNNGTIRKRVVPVQFFELPEDRSEIEDKSIISILPDDPIVKDIQNLGSSSLSKMKVTSLHEDKKDVKQPENSTHNPFSVSPFGSPMNSVRSRSPSSGKLLSIIDNVGFMLVSLSEIESNKLFKIEVPCIDEGGTRVIGVKVYVPDWWPIDDTPES